MSEDGTVTSSLKLDGADTMPSAGIISQYVKDLSVENPNAPACFGWTEAPELEVQFNIASTPVDGGVHEVALKIQLNAKTSQGVAYIVDLTYAGLIGLRNVDESQAHLFIFAEAPRILFPFARRVIADVTRDAGFTPVMLEPIDFGALYFQQLAAQGVSMEDALGGMMGGNAMGGNTGPSIDEPQGNA
jgi:preprotein translocase subunit SecB